MTTMNHPVDREVVMAWIDGELSGARALEIAAHVDGCADCQTLVRELRALSAGLAAWEVEPAPAGIASGVAAIPTITRPPKTDLPGAPLQITPMWRRARVWGLAAAAVLVLLLIPTVWVAKSRQLPDAERPAANAQRRVQTIGIQGQGGNARPMFIGESLVQPGSMVVRTASLTLTTDAFDRARADIERIATDHGGQIAALEVSGAPPRPRSLRATLRLPAARLDDALAAVRRAGRVEQESLGSEDVTDRYRDLTVRIANSRREEQRLVELLGQRTGTLADVLAVEQAIARVRGEIERMESEERATKGRVDLATVTVQLSENYRADASLPSTALGTQFRNALVDGLRAAFASLTAVALAIVRLAPGLLVWMLILAWPARALWRRRPSSMRPNL